MSTIAPRDQFKPIRIVENLVVNYNEQCFHVVLFIMLYKVVLTLKSVDENLVCDHSNVNYLAVLSWGTVYYAVQGGSNLEVCG